MGPHLLMTIVADELSGLEVLGADMADLRVRLDEISRIPDGDSSIPLLHELHSESLSRFPPELVKEEPSELDAIMQGWPDGIPRTHGVASPLRNDMYGVEGENLVSGSSKGDMVMDHLGYGLSTLRSKVRGAWLGRSIGCLLGKPVEGFPPERISAILVGSDSSPLDDYFLPFDHDDGLSRAGQFRGEIRGMVVDDDLDYTALALLVMEQHDLGFTTSHVGKAWLENLPYDRVYTAEKVAYANLVRGLPATSAPSPTATTLNPYREWIGAQIRADMWGWVLPGLPFEAARLAHRDASLSHTANGIFGEMWAAAMCSLAFSESDPRIIVERALQVIPSGSRLAGAIRTVLDGGDPQLPDYSFVHTINNAVIVTRALLESGGDLGKGLCAAVEAGLDTDCNGATVGSILGAVMGDTIPERWSDPIGDILRTSLASVGTASIDDLTDRTIRAILGRTE